jgi:hypothetical protein
VASSLTEEAKCLTENYFTGNSGEAAGRTSKHPTHAGQPAKSLLHKRRYNHTPDSTNGTKNLAKYAQKCINRTDCNHLQTGDPTRFFYYTIDTSVTVHPIQFTTQPPWVYIYCNATLSIIPISADTGQKLTLHIDTTQRLLKFNFIYCMAPCTYTAVLCEPNGIPLGMRIFHVLFTFIDSNLIAGLMMIPQLGRN